MVNFADLPKHMLIEICDALHGDGHSMYKPQLLTKLHVPDAYVKSVTHKHDSDGTYKGTMFDEHGDVIQSTVAIYGLSVYRRIGADLGLPPSKMSGRGFEARDWDQRIREALSE
jgi:hypothetical protein